MIHPLEVHLMGMSGLCAVRFLAVIPQGRGRREVAVDVSPDLVLRIADALRATAGAACDTPTSRISDEGHPARYHVGHAIWHVERPGEPMPCVDRSGAIDVGTCARLEDGRGSASVGAWSAAPGPRRPEPRVRGAAAASEDPADRAVDPASYADQVWLVQEIRRWIEEDPGKSRWTLTRGQLEGLLSVTRGQLEGLLSVIGILSGDEP
jgi:hypothetical protein